jgi:hypothetical protein
VRPIIGVDRDDLDLFHIFQSDYASFQLLLDVLTNTHGALRATHVLEGSQLELV